MKSISELDMKAWDFKIRRGCSKARKSWSKTCGSRHILPRRRRPKKNRSTFPVGFYHEQENWMHLIPRMATALVFFIYIGEEGLNAQFLTKKYQTPKQLCGAALSNELQLVCEGVYNNMIKKSEGPVHESANHSPCACSDSYCNQPPEG